ncbi:LysR family transcriptional regulator [Paenibacillus turpanensis]|uniref:LysR family transcriptional regulator n=1 Tax=Paenibacillus turpanensis TaxID=2689078 RepID=UPI00140CFC58|nr:LysR family transcriptional regulator [Paenibacillus turpanensis]
MELRQLQYALQIAAEKNFSRAAEKLHIAQPSLSQQLAKLEREIGTLLFHRNTGSVELTHAGSVFIGKAQSIIDMVEQLKQEMDDLTHMRKGKLVIGSLPITGAHMLPLVLPAFRAAYPQIEISLVEDTTAHLEHLTSSGQADISLLTLPIGEASIAYEELIEEEICLAVPPDHRLAGMDGGPLYVQDLRNEPFIVLKKGQGFRQIAIDLCQEAGFEPNIVFESSNIETVQSLVASGMGIAFVPQMIARSGWNRYTPVILSFAEPRPTRTIVLAYRKGRYLSKAAEAFIDTVKSVVSDGLGT